MKLNINRFYYSVGWKIMLNGLVFVSQIIKGKTRNFIVNAKQDGRRKRCPR